MSQSKRKTMPHEYRSWLIAIIAVAVILRIGASLFLGDKILPLPGIADQIHYHTLATRIIEGHGFTFGQIWWPMTKADAPTAHWSYLYTFFITVVYLLFGYHPLAARLIQSTIASVIMPWFLFRITIHVFQQKLTSTSRTKSSPNIKPYIIGLIAATWISIYGYFIYYAAALMTETFYIIGILWVFDTTFRISDINRKHIHFLWVELGIAMGFTILLRQVFLLFIPFILLWLIFVRWKTNHIIPTKDIERKIITSTLPGEILAVSILILIILPFSIFNYQRFGRFVLLNTNSGFAFYWSNHPIYGTHFLPILPKSKGSYQDLIPANLRNLDEAALDQALLLKGIQFVSEDPLRYLMLSLSRIPAYFKFLPSSESSIISNITRVFSFGLSLPFMLAGIGLWVYNLKKERYSKYNGLLLLLFVVIYSCIHLLSWSLIRYRLPVDAIGLIFASFTLYEIYYWFKSKQDK
jgi:hypothetical protein